MNLNHVTLPATNVLKSIDFYKKLGLQLIVHTHDNYARFLCMDGDSTISLHTVEKVQAAEGVIIYFEVDDVDSEIEHLAQQGLTIASLPEQKSWLWYEAALLDPDGNKIIIYKAGKNRINPPWRLTE